MSENLSKALGILILVFIGIAMIALLFNLPLAVKVDLPEEYEQISKDHLKPDTLLGYYHDNKLYIEFKSKR